jgi:hypothetical protein
MSFEKLSREIKAVTPLYTLFIAPISWKTPTPFLSLTPTSFIPENLP